MLGWSMRPPVSQPLPRSERGIAVAARVGEGAVKEGAGDPKRSEWARAKDCTIRKFFGLDMRQHLGGGGKGKTKVHG